MWGGREDLRPLQGEALAAKSLKVISLTEKGPPGVFAGLENWGSM